MILVVFLLSTPSCHCFIKRAVIPSGKLFQVCLYSISNHLRLKRELLNSFLYDPMVNWVFIVVKKHQKIFKKYLRHIVARCHWSKLDLRLNSFALDYKSDKVYFPYLSLLHAA